MINDHLEVYRKRQYLLTLQVSIYLHFGLALQHSINFIENGIQWFLSDKSRMFFYSK